MTQLIAEPIHVLENSSSCIDLIFTNQPNLIMDSGVHPSLHSKCHHQVIYTKLNFQIEYPPPYIREVWDYLKAQVNLINKAIKNFNWNELFSGQNIHNQIELFNTTILNIFRNLFQIKLFCAMIRGPPG